MGKDYRRRKSESDFFQTPYGMTKQLLAVETFPQPVLDPACGENAIVDVLKAHPNYSSSKVEGFDIIDGTDFLNWNGKIPAIITNPPFSHLDEFIKKASTVCTGKYAMLIKYFHLTGIKRYNSGILKELKRVWLFTRQAMLSPQLREDGKYEPGMYVYAWAVFYPGHDNRGKFETIWLNNHDWIVTRKDRIKTA
jgi:hypothetical protein